MMPSTSTQHALPAVSEFLTTTQSFLFESGRVLLTAAVILFLGYAIFIGSALLVSAVRASTHRTWLAPGSADRPARTGARS